MSQHSRWSGAAALIVFLTTLPSIASAQWTTCPRAGGFWGNQVVCSHKALNPRVTFTTPVRTFLDQSWRSFWEMDTSNVAVWINFSSLNTSCTHCTHYNGNCFNRNFTVPAGGQACVWAPFTCVDEVDIGINPGSVDTHAICADQGFTEEGTFVHEAGHAYGYAHFDDWLSTMNTSQPDVTSCQSRADGAGGTRRRVRPAAQSQQCHRDTYGLPPRRDVGATPLRQVCSLTSAGCATVFSATSTISTTSTSTLGWVDYTRMNMRNAMTPGTNLDVEVFMSSDATLSAGDVSIYSGTTGTMAAGETIRQQHVFFFNPQVAMPVVGVTYCMMVELDPSNRIIEFAEDDNVIDTQTCYIRI